LSACALVRLSTTPNAPTDTWPTIFGLGLGLIAGFTYALYPFCAHSLLVRTDRGTIGRAAGMGAIFGLGGLALMPVLLATGAPLLTNSRTLTVGVYMALVPMFIGYLLFGYGLTRVTASAATTLTLAEPAIAAILAVLIVGERLAPIGWIGMVAIGAALLVLSLGPATRRPTRRDKTNGS